MAKHDEFGREIPDPTPVAVPAGWSRPVPLQQQIQAMIRTELSRKAVEDGQESFEEADDFDVDEEPDPLSPYEMPEGLPERPTRHETLDGGIEPPSPPSEAPTGPKKAVSGDPGNSGQTPSPDSGTKPAGK